MFGFGKKKEVPLKEQPGYGTAKHYHAYAVGEAEKMIKEYGLDKNKYISFTFTPLDNGCLFNYVPIKNNVSLTRVNENGELGGTLLMMSYKDGKIGDKSFFGNATGKEIESSQFKDGMYTLASSELQVPAFVNVLTPNKEAGITPYALKATNQKIQWQGVGCNSGSIGGIIDMDPRQPSQAI